MVVIRRYLLVAAYAVVTSSAPLLLRPTMAQADCCIYPKPTSVQKKEDCCIFPVGSKEGKSFEGRVKDVDKDTGELVIEGTAIRKGATFTVQPKEKIGEFRKGEEVKGMLVDPGAMKFEYEFRRK